MKPLFQKILREAEAELEQELRCGEGLEGWDPDDFERQVREFTRGLGLGLTQVWGVRESCPGSTTGEVLPLQAKATGAGTQQDMVAEHVWASGGV